VNRSILFDSGFQAGNQPGAAPKLNAERADKKLCLLNCDRVVRANQRLIAIKMPVGADEVSPILFHPEVPTADRDKLAYERPDKKSTSAHNSN
jgi:hypothetical protein